MAAILKVCCHIRNPIRKSPHIFAKNNPANFHLYAVWNYGVLGFFEERHPNKNNKNNNNNWVTIWDQFLIRKLKKKYGCKKGKGVCKLFMEIQLTATECHLPYGITQCYLPPDTSENTPPLPQPDSNVRYATVWQMWMNVTSSMVDANSSVRTRRVHIPAAVTMVSFWRKTAGHATVRHHHRYYRHHHFEYPWTLLLSCLNIQHYCVPLFNFNN